MTTPAPGWYSDPADGRMVRWWAGDGWTEHVRPFPEPAPAPQPPNPAFGQQYRTAQPSWQQTAQPTYTREPRMTIARGEKDRQVRRNNPMAYLGLVFSLLGLIVNPFAILSILGIVFSSIGWAKSGELSSVVRYSGKVTAIIGVILGVATLAYFGWTFSRAFV